MPKGITKKEDRWQNIEYWIKRNPDCSLEECKRMRAEKLRASREARPSNRKYWERLHPEWTSNEVEEALRKYKSENSPQCIEYWRKRYPDASESELKVMLENKKADYLSKRPDNHGENNPRHRSKTTEKERREGSPSSIEFYIKRNPDKTAEECEAMRQKHIKSLSKTHTKENTTTCTEYWIKKGYTKQEAKRIIHDLYTFTLEKCIKKYGDKDGRKFYEERQKRWLKSLRGTFKENNGIPQSRWAQSIIEKIIELLPEAEPEFIIGKYSFDIRYENKLIEFNGDYFHCNPKMYDADFYNKLSKKTAKEIWDKDKKKISIAESNGYKVFVLWEFDSVSKSDFGVQECIDFLSK